jgi:uncharacterized membrane protein
MRHRNVIAITVGLTMIAFGLSQLAKPRKWEKYIPKSVDTLLPVKKSIALRIHGGANIMLGSMLLINIKPVLTRSVAGVWWMWVALFCGRFDWRVALRDVAVGITLLSIIKRDDR